MRLPIRCAPGRRLRWLLLVPVVLGLVACGATSSLASVSTPVTTATPTNPPRPAATLDRVTNTHTFTDSVKDGGTTAPCANGDPLIKNDCGVTVTANCPDGEEVVSGGYNSTPTISNAFSTSSYPSSSGTWTVTVHAEGNGVGGPPISITVTAVANCLKANFPTTMQIVTSTANIPADGTLHTVTATCPSGTILTGGGYRAALILESKMPSGNGWSAGVGTYSVNSADPTVYAVCSASHVQPALVARTTKTFGILETPTLVQPCPAGTTLVGGGFEFGQDSGTGISGSQSSGDGTGWQVQISGVESSGPGSVTLTLYALCTTFA